ncbi:sulfatase [bacterium]|nr:sulfatase [bacterium]
MGAAGVVLSASGLLNGCTTSGDRPNIVLIFTDDQGYGDVGVYGAKGFITPHLDRLASEGMRFTDFYASQAVCSASRASLLTGCYAERVSILGALMPWSEIGLNPEETTIAGMLKKRGYATGMFGKWHLGHHREYLPVHHGFDEYLGLPYSNDMWPVDFDGNPVEKGHKKNYPSLPLIEGDEVVDHIETLDDQATLTTRYAERAVGFIEKNRHTPLFLYLAHSMPHVPLGVSEKFKGSSEQGMYGDVIEEIDWSVGQVMAALDRYDLSDNTLVIFTSDNGPWLNFGNHAGTTGGLREGKGTAFEGGPRVPAIMRWPGRIAPGSICEKMASTIDILPTLAALTGAVLPEKPIDGVSILPLLEGDETANPRNTFLYYYGAELRGVREGRWKRVFAHRTRSYVGVEPGRDGHPGSYAFPAVPAALYDLKTDPAETMDVAAQHPDVVIRLDTLAEEARTSLGDRLMHRKGCDVRPPGRRSFERESEVKNLAVGASIMLTHAASPQYPGNGAETLINGRPGSRDFHDLEWLGFESMDLEALIDLGSLKSVKKVSGHFLRNQASWIFLPERVTVSVSTDGSVYTWAGSIQVKQVQDLSTAVESVGVEVGQDVRFIKLKAVNIGQCPLWHVGAGNKAWLFCDEIVVMANTKWQTSSTKWQITNNKKQMANTKKNMNRVLSET